MCEMTKHESGTCENRYLIKREIQFCSFFFCFAPGLHNFAISEFITLHRTWIIFSCLHQDNPISSQFDPKPIRPLIFMI